MSQKYGQLSREDIITELESGKLVISPRAEHAKDEPNIKTASFDISPSCLIMSVKRGSFMRIYSCMSQCKKGHRNPEWHCNAKYNQKNLITVLSNYLYILNQEIQHWF